MEEIKAAGEEGYITEALSAVGEHNEYTVFLGRPEPEDFEPA